MRTLIRLEELGIFLFSIYLFSGLPFPWWTFPVFLFAPDISMAAYIGGPRLGAFVYNLIHHRALDLVLYVTGILTGAPLLALAGIIMFAHSSLDRALGYGLKFPDAFTNTHLGRIGPSPHPS
jgi:hypothetical protein